VRPLQLHGRSRHDPDRFLEIDLLPTRLTELTRPDEQQRRKLKRELRGQLAVLAFNGLQQRSQLSGLGDGGAMADLGGHECTAEVH
jgi:hypothetical protein